MSSVSRINQLPDELLAFILATSLRDLPSDAHQPLLALICSICCHWRDVAIGASELWTTVHIPVEGDLPVIQRFLERSKGRLIDLHITALDSELAHKVAEITAPHISRARTLNMILPDFRVYNIFSKAYCSISATTLSSLSIHLTGWSFHNHSPLFASTNTLCYLDTEGEFLRDVPSRASLTTIELNKYSPTHVEFQNLFDASPCLETLVLHEIILVAPMRANEDDIPPTTITAPTTLKSLAVSVSYTHNNATGMCGCVLDRLCIPSLEYLEVAGIADLAIDLNIHFRGLSKIQTLRIRHCTITSADQFFLSLKELRRLELVDMSPELDIYHITGISAPGLSSPTFPHLSSIFFSTKRKYMDSSYQLLQFAEHCVAAGCPRFTLEVEQGRSEEFLNPIESRIQDGRICVMESDCSDGLIKLKPTGIHSRFFGDLDAEEFEDDEIDDDWEPEWEIEDDAWEEVEDDASEFDEEE